MASDLESLVVRLERRRWLWQASALTITVAAAIRTAAAKPLWSDELLTYYLAGLDRISDLPSALADAADCQPILGYLLTRLSLSVISNAELAVRAPSIAAFGVAAWVIFRFTAQRAGAAAAAAAVFFLGLTEAFPLASEGRPYGLLLAFTALSLWSWTEVVRGARRGLALAGLGLSLAGALASHYYAGMIFFPIAVGELVRSRRRRRADFGVWAVMAAALLVLVAHWPFVSAIRRVYSGGFWSPAEPLDLAGSYVYLLASAFFPILVTIVCWALLSRGGGAEGAQGRTLPEERAALAALAALPFVAVPLALLVTHAFVYRYVSPVLVGLAILFGLATEHVAAKRRTAAAATALLLMGWFVVVRVVLPAPPQDATARAAAVERLAGSTSLPIVVANPLLFLEHFHYGSSALAERLVYLADPAWALSAVGADSPDRNLVQLRRWIPLRVEGYEELLAATPDFLLCRLPGDRFEWLSKRLKADGKRLREIGRAGSLQLSECCR